MFCSAWPEVAPWTPVADVVICHHVVYDVGDVVLWDDLSTLHSATLTDPDAPRPDAVPVNFEQLFAEVQVDTPGPGLHVGMRGEGETVLTGPGGFIFLAGNEGGWLPQGQDVPV